MATYYATIDWSHDGGDFLKGRYSRLHTVSFVGGVTVVPDRLPHESPPRTGKPPAAATQKPR